MNAPIQHHSLLTQPLSKWFDVHPKLGITTMDHLFNRLDGAYPHKWRTNFPNEQSIANWRESWAEAFEDEGITLNDVRDGLKACRTRYDWPPSCAEFIKACKPSIDPLVGYYEATAGVQARQNGQVGKWSHPAIFWAAMPMSYDLAHQTFSQIKGQWEAALKEQMGRGHWEEIPPARSALPSPDKCEQSREHSAAMLTEFGATGVLKNKTDHKAWAKRIQTRIAAGDKTITLIQKKFADEAILEVRRM